MSANPHLERLARELLTRTRRGLVKWIETDDPTSFLFSSPQGSIIVDSLDRDGGPPYGMRVLREDGIEVDRLTSEWYSGLLGSKEPAPWNGVLDELYNGARRTALNVDQVVGGMLDYLRQQGTEQEPDQES